MKTIYFNDKKQFNSACNMLIKSRKDFKTMTQNIVDSFLLGYDSLLHRNSEKFSEFLKVLTPNERKLINDYIKQVSNIQLYINKNKNYVIGLKDVKLDEQPKNITIELNESFNDSFIFVEKVASNDKKPFTSGKVALNSCKKLIEKLTISSFSSADLDEIVETLKNYVESLTND